MLFITMYFVISVNLKIQYYDFIIFCLSPGNKLYDCNVIQPLIRNEQRIKCYYIE